MVALFLLGCLSLTESKLTVVNTAPLKTGWLTITVDKQQVWSGTLRPGEESSVGFTPQKQAPFVVSGDHAGVRFPAVAVGEVVRGDGKDHHLRLFGTLVRHRPDAQPVALRANRVQQIVDHPGVSSMLHPEVSGHLPLQIQADEGYRVEVINTIYEGQWASYSEHGRLVLTRDKRHPSRIDLAIPAEGMVGAVRFQGPTGAWSIASLEVSEQ